MPVLGSFSGFDGRGPGQGHGPQPADSYAIRAEVDRMNNRDLTEHGKELGQYVRGMYDSGVKMYDKDMFREAEDAVAVDPRPEVIHIRSSKSCPPLVRSLPHAMRTSLSHARVA